MRWLGAAWASWAALPWARESRPLQLEFRALTNLQTLYLFRTKVTGDIGNLRVLWERVSRPAGARSTPRNITLGLSLITDKEDLGGPRNKRDMKTRRDVLLGIYAILRNTEMAQSSKTLAAR